MSYCTKFNLDMQPFDQTIIGKLRLMYDSAEYTLDESGDCRQEGNWFDWENDLKEFSKQYPKVLFILYGEGEDNIDIWKAHIQNGKCKKVSALISFPVINPDDLN